MLFWMFCFEKWWLKTGAGIRFARPGSCVKPRRRAATPDPTKGTDCRKDGGRKIFGFFSSRKLEIWGCLLEKNYKIWVLLKQIGKFGLFIEKSALYTWEQNQVSRQDDWSQSGITYVFPIRLGGELAFPNQETWPLLPPRVTPALEE